MNTCKNCQEVFELEVPYNGKYSVGSRIYQCPKCGFKKIQESVGSNRKIKKSDFEKLPKNWQFYKKDMVGVKLVKKNFTR